MYFINSRKVHVTDWEGGDDLRLQFVGAHGGSATIIKVEIDSRAHGRPSIGL
jgi:hypothetical protein